ncbi:hypothetical protein HJG60_010021 [Phyllostomus discolor]|uniref:Uncharacterized protein n=1 Tax=Phyllostomus discolor TaxID=89673 RepID=A0A834AVU0_9CHIR|nr:hypothetical protein HJG60_010021 [Phyllostomus discolor]
MARRHAPHMASERVTLAAATVPSRPGHGHLERGGGTWPPGHALGAMVSVAITAHPQLCLVCRAHPVPGRTALTLNVWACAQRRMGCSPPAPVLHSGSRRAYRVLIGTALGHCGPRHPPGSPAPPGPAPGPGTLTLVLGWPGRRATVRSRPLCPCSPARLLCGHGHIPCQGREQPQVGRSVKWAHGVRAAGPPSHGAPDTHGGGHTHVSSRDESQAAAQWPEVLWRGAP